MTNRFAQIGLIWSLTAGVAAAAPGGALPVSPFDGVDTPAEVGAFVPGEVIVKFRGEGPSLEALTRWSGVKWALSRHLSGGEWLLYTPDRARDARAWARAFSARGDVQYAQPNRLYRPLAAPNDPYYVYQWHYEAIDLPAAWELEQGDRDVVVAVLDTGITDHPELLAKRATGYDLVSHLYNSADGDGFDPDPTDPGRLPLYHGTHVAGTVGAESNNGVGVAGVCQGCLVAPVRVLGSMWGTSADIIDGMRWAIGMPVEYTEPNPTPAQILNLSLGEQLEDGQTCAVDDPAMQAAVDDVTASGAIMVVAAGNSGMDAWQFSPASCNGVITVAAVSRGDFMSYYTNYGTSVEIAAPGGGFTGFIWSTYDVDLYMGFVGTSQASPHVAGVVGLLLSARPDLDGADVLEILQSTSDPLDSRHCPRGCGAGRVNASAALTRALEW